MSLAPFENRLTLADLSLLNEYNEVRGICSYPVPNVFAEFALQHDVIAKELNAKGNAQLDVKIVYFKKGSLEHTVLGTAILDLSQLKNNRDRISATIFKSNSGTFGQVQSRPGL